MKGISGKTYLITGASSGIGQEVAILLSELDAQVIITGRNQERVQQTFLKLKHNSGKNHQMLIGDLNDPVFIKNLSQQILILSGVVLCAGIVEVVPFKFFSLEKALNHFNINFFAPMLLVKELYVTKKLDTPSSLVFLSSVAGTKIGVKGNSIYAATKGAISAAVKVLSLELAKSRIRVNSVAPGLVVTPMIDGLKAISDKDLERDKTHYPLGFGSPSQIAEAVIFLLSDSSSWITGSDLVVDGGISIV